MASTFAIRRLRYLSTAAVAPAIPSSSISISEVKSKLGSEYHPDKALEIYSVSDNPTATPTFARSIERLAVRRLVMSRRFAELETLIESHKKDNPLVTQEPYVASLIQHYGRAGMFDHALKTYEQMDDLGAPRSVLSFNALLCACNHSRSFNRTSGLFSEFPKKFSFVPDAVSYSLLVKSYCDAGSLQMAMGVLKELEDKGIEITAATFTPILVSLYKKGKVDEADKLWKDMQEKGCALDTAAYNVRMMHAQKGKPENVKALIEEMTSVGLKPDTISFNYLLTCFCNNGMMEEAKKVYEGLSENGCRPNAATFRTLIFHLCKAEDFEEAFLFFQKSEREDRIPNFGTLKHLFKGLMKQEKLKEARDLIEVAKKKFPDVKLNAWKKCEKDLNRVTSAAASAAQEVTEEAAV